MPRHRPPLGVCRQRWQRRCIPELRRVRWASFKPVCSVGEKGSPRSPVSPSRDFAVLSDPGRVSYIMPSRCSDDAPARHNMKATALMTISRFNHKASSHAVYASQLRLPYTGKTGLLLVANLCRMRFEPIGLIWLISRSLPCHLS
jgi:hypothetical protein